ncbi:hypothetical protein N1851_012545 [Merluccius polli]|uniref:Uncharacterized protein n=1 Tax=Merluccius polli TaxID=89951 RepID=A0AA47MW17_MERPO|nr:hypothetical protein N1851_012545 [Merluccius polli]
MHGFIEAPIGHCRFPAVCARACLGLFQYWDTRPLHENAQKQGLGQKSRVRGGNGTGPYSGVSSHMYGSSTTNQRIESWWSIFRKGRSQFWMELFADLRDAGYFNGSHEHQCLLRCSSEGLCVRLWNSHRIRPSRTASCPGGVPNELYYLPHR